VPAVIWVDGDCTVHVTTTAGTGGTSLNWLEKMTENGASKMRKIAGFTLVE